MALYLSTRMIFFVWNFNIVSIQLSRQCHVLMNVEIAGVISMAAYPMGDQMTELYQIGVSTIDGRQTTLAEYQNKVLLIVNVASKCGFTDQYAGLEKLYRKHHKNGLVILGFPCNQFGSQEPGTEAEIESFCSLNYGVTFPMFAKIEVNGKNAHPLYIFLKKEHAGTKNSVDIKWNFTKFLIDRNGRVKKRYPPSTTPAGLEGDVEELLEQSLSL